MFYDRRPAGSGGLAGLFQEPRLGIGYIRISEAKAEMYSPETQLYQMNQRAARDNIKIIDVVYDIDRTGRTLAKRKIMTVLGRIQAGEAHVLMSWKLSRIGRNLVETVKIVNEIEKSGAQYVSATEDIDTSTSQGRWMLHQIAAMDQFYSDNIGDTWKETIDRRIRDGLAANGRARFGYKRCDQCVKQPPKVVDGKEKSMGYYPCKACGGVPEVDPVNGPALKDAYEMYLGGDGFTVIAATMRTRGIRSAQGKLIDDAGWRTLMDTGFAAGLLCGKSQQFTPGKHPIPWDLWADGVHPRIIERDVWNKYVARRVERYSQTGRALTRAYSLSGLVLCGAALDSGKTCHGSMNIFHSPDYGHAYLKCTMQTRLKVCKGTNVRLDDLEAEVKRWILAEATPPDRADQAFKREAKTRKVQTELEQVKAEKERLLANRRRLVKGYTSGDIEPEDYRPEKAVLDADIEAVTAKIEALGGTLLREAPEAAAFRGLLTLWNDPDVTEHEINHLLSQVVGYITVTSVKYKRTFTAAITPTWEMTERPSARANAAVPAPGSPDDPQPPKSSATPAHGSDDAP